MRLTRSFSNGVFIFTSLAFINFRAVITAPSDASGLKIDFRRFLVRFLAHYLTSRKSQRCHSILRLHRAYRRTSKLALHASGFIQKLGIDCQLIQTCYKVDDCLAPQHSARRQSPKNLFQIFLWMCVRNRKKNISNRLWCLPWSASANPIISLSCQQI